MSRVGELVEEFCPDGVKFEPLGDLGVWYGGGTPSKTRQDFWDRGTVPWLSPKDMGRPTVTTTQDYITESAIRASATKLVPANSVAVVVRSSILDKVLPIALIPIPITLNQDMKALTPREDVLARYIAHLLRSCAQTLLRATRKTGGSVVSIDVPKFMAFRVPVPPLEVQREIVRILDQFTALEAALEAELEAELEARRNQYRYYRSAILSFPTGEGARWATLGDICVKVSSGGTPPSGRSDYYGGNIPWLRTQEVDYTEITATGVTITEEGMRNSSAKWIPPHCVIVAMYGATAAKVAVNTIPLTTNQACCNLQVDPSQVEYRYVFHWLANEYERLKALGEGSQSNLNARKVKDYPIPVPSLARQREIVSTLDKFDALFHDLSSGLPAELNARRTQYAYYRDRLLTFKEWSP